MTNKIDRVGVFSEFTKAFKCPHCKGPIKVLNSKSLICCDNHTFDFAKQGYVNMMTGPSKSHYSKELFEARKKIITQSDLYSVLHERISKEIKGHLNHRFPSLLFDAGCGEGSHLHNILDKCRNTAITGVGLDISKDGIFLAAKSYKGPMWIVGDLANSPLEDHSFHVILNILSPSNYKEFKRILVPNGLVIKVVPRPNYLKELREELFKGTEKKSYKNDETVKLFNKHFKLKDIFNLCYTKKLDQAELKNLVQMSPLAWSADKAHIDAFVNRASSEITVDLDILIGLNDDHPILEEGGNE
ncbi:MAG: putative RNA methyltransferase [Heyndrickxia sp.]